MTDIIERLRIESRREPHEPIWRDAIDEIEALRAEVDALLDALRQIAEWPDGGNRYGQGNIKRFAQAAIEAARQQPTEGEEIMVNAAHDVYTLPLRPSGLSSGPRFVVHVPGPEQPAAVDGALRAIVEAIVAQAPVVTDSGMVHVWLDAALLDGARAALNLKAGASWNASAEVSV